jgi:branched-chain amino acid transport system ATP-binding protein
VSVETICAPVSAPAAAAAPLLRVRDVTIRFGGIIALDAVSFDLREGQILGLIGPNGAGKTTMFNCLTRLYTPNSGEIVFRGQNLLAAPPHRVAGLGISRTFQNLALFRTLSVLDNVRVGQHACASGDFLSDALRLPASRRREAELDAEAWDLIESLGLAEVAQRCVADLPTGTQKRVELARALAARPRLVLLDEPAGGLSHHDVAELGRLIDDVRTQRGVTVLLVEHHMGLVMSVSDRVVALDFGRRIAEGSPDEVRNDAEVIRAYLGSAKR